MKWNCNPGGGQAAGGVLHRAARARRRRRGRRGRRVAHHGAPARVHGAPRRGHGQDALLRARHAQPRHGGLQVRYPCIPHAARWVTASCIGRALPGFDLPVLNLKVLC